MPDPLDEFVPRPQFRELHELHIGQNTETVWTALKTLSAQDMPIVRTLMGIRSLPARGRAAFARDPVSMLTTMLNRGWFELSEVPDQHVVIGSIGQYWRLRPGSWRRSCKPEEFGAYDVPGFAKSASAFQLIPDGDSTILRTETRVAVGRGPARRKMAAYWFVIRPFSGLIRMLMLRAVANRARKLSTIRDTRTALPPE